MSGRYSSLGRTNLHTRWNGGRNLRLWHTSGADRVLLAAHGTRSRAARLRARRGKFEALKATAVHHLAAG